MYYLKNILKKLLLTDKVKVLIEKKPKFVLTTSIIVCIVSIIALINSDIGVELLLAIMFASSLLCSVRVITSVLGYLPGRDATWRIMKFGHTREDAEDGYKNFSLNVAIVCYPISVISFIVWATVEIIFMILK